MHPPPLELFSDSFSVALWVRYSPLTQTLSLASLTYVFTLSVSTAGVLHLPVLRSTSVGEGASTVVLSDSQWQHIGVTVTSNSLKIYFNGVLQQAFTSLTNSANFVIKLCLPYRVLLLVSDWASVEEHQLTTMQEILWFLELSFPILK